VSGTDSAFGERLRATLAVAGRLCVGIDPHEGLLDAWGLPVTAAGVRTFGLRVVEACAGRAGIVKPQVSFFERFGSAGYAALEEVIAAARAAGLIVIADAKRGDIGTTMDAYARAWLSPGSALEVDAVTLSPYLGVGSLQDTLAFALAHGKGAFVLAATSNPEAAALQSARTMDAAPSRSVAASVVAEVSAFNARTGAPGEWASAGFVIGATVDRAAVGLDATIEPIAPILAPGFGHQGARPEDLLAIFGALAPAVIVSESRSILSAGPDGMEQAIDDRRGVKGMIGG
jgi:orotidine-5'-phosphate decarboxylase